jgi:hypothetical protein
MRYRRFIRPIFGYLVAIAGFTWFCIDHDTAAAQSIGSTYTKLDLEKDCEWQKPVDEIDEQMGGRAICSGYGVYPVLFAEGDLRQFLHYGPVPSEGRVNHGFMQWNRVHDTIEWRLSDGKPFATIHRWFIENLDPETGSPSPAYTGEVLRIATVGNPALAESDRTSCTVGYVDAKANPDANFIARDVADRLAPSFRCSEDQPRYYGIRGPLSGSPNDIAQN